LLLALDTATATASVAIYDPSHQRLLAETTWQARRRHTQDLMATIQHTLRQASLTVADVSALAVTTGPGSFTGVRIGISAIKGLGLGLPGPAQVVGLPTLSITASPWLGIAGSVWPRPLVCAYIQAGRGRYNWTWFGPEDLLCRPGREDHSAGTAAEFAAELLVHEDGPAWLVGELDKSLCEAIAGIAHVTTVDAVSATRRAGQLARLAALHLENGHGDGLAELQPLYLRNP
jgi:tRNA threonylcarbamoyladenosine biosynthesis protein TsaB